jgi:putative ABC transport system substrate-binding protein
MRRREFIKVIGGTAAVWPVIAIAQQPGLPIVAFVGGGTAVSAAIYAAAFRKGLSESGYVDGQNVTVEYHWLEGQPGGRLPGLMADLVRRRVAVIFTGNNVGTLAAIAATSDVPIVFVFGLDPVLMGLVASINRPGGNATGVSFQVSALEPKRFELVRNLVPQVSLVGVLVNPDNPNAKNQDLQAVAPASGPQLLILEARSDADIDTAFATLVQQHGGALLVTSDVLFDIQRHQLVDLAARNTIPTMYPWRGFADDGGLMSYGNSLSGAVQQGGLYVGRILRGDKPADLPVWQPTKFEFVINLKTAKALGIAIPSALLTFADEVIE